MPAARLLPVLVVLLALTAPAAATDTARAPIDPLVLRTAGRQSALVHVLPDASLRGAIADARQAGADIGTTYGAIKVFVAYGDAETLQGIAASSRIEWIEANRPVRLFTDTSHRATRGQDVLEGAVTLPDGTRIDGTGVGVAVVDSGVEGTHPDLASRMGGNVRIYCAAPGGGIAINLPGLGFSECRGPKEAVALADTDTPGAGGHGTHVAGIVAGTGAASGGRFHGAAPGATLYGVGVGTSLLVENGLDGLRWVLENHDQVDPPIRVVNNSWGSGYREPNENDNLTGAVTKLQNLLIADGVTVVFAAGNGGGNGSSPTTSVQCLNPTPGNVCVAASYDDDAGNRDGPVASFSSRGVRDNPNTPDNEADPATWPDVTAPGEFIISTCRWTLPVCSAHAYRRPGAVVTNPPNSYSEIAGTSMAAPHVAGIIAQLYQVDPTLNPARVEDILEDTAYKFAFGDPYTADPFNPNDTSSFEKGHGLVDVVEAVRATGAATGTKLAVSKCTPHDRPGRPKLPGSCR